VYSPTADVSAYGDTGDIFAEGKATITDDAVSDTLILQLNNMDQYPVGEHTVEITVGLTLWPGVSAYTIPVRFTVYDCSVEPDVPMIYFMNAVLPATEPDSKDFLLNSNSDTPA